MPPRVQPRNFPPSVLPIGERDLKVSIPPGRSSFLPEIYRAFDHPLYHGRGTAYYFIQDGSLDKMKEVYTYEDGQTSFPQGPEDEALDAGKSSLIWSLLLHLMFDRLS